MKSLKYRFLSLGTTAMMGTFLIPQSVNAGTLTKDGRFLVEGIAEVEVQSFNGTLNGINVDLGQGPVTSGDISFSLDTTKSNKLTLDFDTSVATLDINYLLQSPLLTQLGEPPAEINVLYSSPLTPFNVLQNPSQASNSVVPITTTAESTVRQPNLPDQQVEGTGILELVAPSNITAGFVFDNPPNSPIVFDGTGTIQTGSLEGFEYENSSVSAAVTIILVVTDSIIRINDALDDNGDDNGVVIPEPATSPLILALVLGVVGFLTRKRSRKVKQLKRVVHQTTVG